MHAEWPTHNVSSNTVLNFNVPTSVVQFDSRTPYCNFWDKLGYAF